MEDVKEQNERNDETPGPVRPALQPGNVYVSLPARPMRTLRELSDADLDDLTAVIASMRCYDEAPLRLWERANTCTQREA